MEQRLSTPYKGLPMSPKTNASSTGEEGFSLIIQRGAPGVMYTREALDITDLVIENFNKKG